MWFYDNVTREEFEKAKSLTEEIMLELGAKVIEPKLPYEQGSVSVNCDNSEDCYAPRQIFAFGDEFFRVGGYAEKHHGGCRSLSL